MTTLQGFICKFTGKPCPYIDTSGMTQTKIGEESPENNNGVRATGAMPVLREIWEMIKKMLKP